MKNKIAYILSAIVGFFCFFSCGHNNADTENIKSRYSFEQTLSRLKDTLAVENIFVFSEINHSEEALKAGLNLRPTVVLIVGNSKAGTAIMQEDQLSAIELPLKILIAENEQSEVLISYKNTTSMIRAYQLINSAERAKAIDKKMQKIIIAAAIG